MAETDADGPLELGVEFIELHNECLRGDDEGFKALKKLLDDGADVNQEDACGKTALMIAARHGELEIAELLLQRGALVDKTTKEMGFSTLMWACGHTWKHRNIARWCLERGADVNGTDHNGWTPLMKAVLAGNPDLVKLFVEHGADKTATVVDGLVDKPHTALDLVQYIAPENRESITKLLKIDSPAGASA